MKPSARTTPAIERNREPIAKVLDSVLPKDGLVLEVASGPGAHSAFFAERYPDLRWQPTDCDEGALVSARAWVRELGRDNLLSPLLLDVTMPIWPIERASVVLNINMLHVSAFPASAIGLFSGASRVLEAREPLVLYGPFFQTEVPSAPSNVEFDRQLQLRDPDWGLRTIDEVTAIAADHELDLESTVEMPSNNFVLVFRRR